MSDSFKFWAVIPAAGRARRMGETASPKQYLTIADRTVLEWSLSPILARDDCAGVVVAIAADDTHWSRLPVALDPRVRTAAGGTERAHSVLAGLQALALSDNDFVLVHDAARPCLAADELSGLIEAVRNDPVGGLLAAPVVDTIKRADSEGRVAETVSRESLWRALTPQMFRFGILYRALTVAQQQGVAVTDEAQAVERSGLRPRIVAGRTDNLKITLPEDLTRAERILQEMQSSGGRR